jgi:alpha-L-fucosidase 2
MFLRQPVRPPFTIMKSLLLLASALALIATSSAAVQRDIEYGTAGGESLRLDASVPDGSGPFPAVILVHGGGWTGGDKSGGPKRGYMAPMEEPLTNAGFAWFEVNYRLAPKFPHPACIDDVETAIRWIKAHTGQFHVDPDRIALAGESAGGQLVALAAVRADPGTRVAAVMPFYGPFDLTRGLKPGDPLRGPLAALTGHSTYDGEAQTILRDASPVFAVKPGLPPFLLVHGTGDKSVAFDQSTQMKVRLEAAHVPVELITVPGGVHGMINWVNITPDYRPQVIAWLQRTLATTPGHKR